MMRNDFSTNSIRKSKWKKRWEQSLNIFGSNQIRELNENVFFLLLLQKTHSISQNDFSCQIIGIHLKIVCAEKKFRRKWCFSWFGCFGILLAEDVSLVFTINGAHIIRQYN